MIITSSPKIVLVVIYSGPYSRAFPGFKRALCGFVLYLLRIEVEGLKGFDVGALGFWAA